METICAFMHPPASVCVLPGGQKPNVKRFHQAVWCSGVQLWLLAEMEQFLMRQILGAVLFVSSGSLKTHWYELKNHTKVLFCITALFVSRKLFLFTAFCTNSGVM